MKSTPRLSLILAALSCLALTPSCSQLDAYLIDKTGLATGDVLSLGLTTSEAAAKLKADYNAAKDRNEILRTKASPVTSAKQALDVQAWHESPADASDTRPEAESYPAGQSPTRTAPSVPATKSRRSSASDPSQLLAQADPEQPEQSRTEAAGSTTAHSATVSRPIPQAGQQPSPAAPEHPDGAEGTPAPDQAAADATRYPAPRSTAAAAGRASTKNNPWRRADWRHQREAS